MTKVYISGPMTGLPDNNFPAFNALAAELRDRGFEVVNPAELSTALGDKASWQDYMREDIAALCRCDALVLLMGWQNSQGAMLEIQIAHRLGILIYDSLESFAVQNHPLS